jgi:hypothetical protein
LDLILVIVEECRKRHLSVYGQSADLLSEDSMAHQVSYAQSIAAERQAVQLGGASVTAESHDRLPDVSGANRFLKY